MTTTDPQLSLAAMNILLKLPSRSRPIRMVEAYDKAMRMATDPAGIRPLFAIDSDDRASLRAWSTLRLPMDALCRGPRDSKVEAVNRGIKEFPYKWDVVVVISDDMICQVYGWDEHVRAAFADGNTDRCVHFPDGHQTELCTLPVMGRGYFDRFGYVYHPDYLSLWCDNEQTDVAVRDGRMVRSDVVLFRHDHPAWGTGRWDPLYRHNEGKNAIDKATYERRKAQGFL